MTPQPTTMLHELTRSARTANASAKISARTAGLLGLATLLGLLITDLPARQGVPWWALLAGFVAGELLETHVTIRGEAHTFVLSEVPLTVGLLLADPTELWATYVVAIIVVRMLLARQRTLKSMFNVALAAVDSAVVIVLFDALTANVTGFGPTTWGIALLATTASTVVSTRIIAGVIATIDGLAVGETLQTTLRPALLVTVGSTLVGLNLVLVLQTGGALALLLLTPIAALFLATRGFALQRRTTERLAFVGRCSEVLRSASGVDGAVAALLTELTHGLRAGAAEVVLLGDEHGRPARRAHVRAADGQDLAPLPRQDLGLLDGVAGLDEAELVRADADGVAARYLRGRGYRSAIVAPVRVSRRTAGFVVVADRLGDAEAFEEQDRVLVGAVADHAGSLVERDLLEDAHGRLVLLRGQLEHEATHDELTGLANRKVLFSTLERLEAAGERRAVLFVDLDDFKDVNDRLGHAAGDAVLREVARRLRHTIRPGDTVARFGGDEFAVVAPQDHAEEGLALAERILAALAQPVRIAGETVSVTASVGLARPEDGLDAHDLLGQADAAMYRAKAAGKGRVRVLDMTGGVDLAPASGLHADLRAAVEGGELSCAFQPIVDTASGMVVGAEALARWHHPRLGTLRPDTFVPLAEATGLVVDLDRAVLRAAVRAGARAFGDPRRPGWISVNVSAVGLRDGFALGVLEVLAAEGIAPQRLVVEITETALPDDGAAAISELCRLRSAGVRVAIDDFGTGTFSFERLRRLPVDILKVDRDLIVNLDVPHDVAIAQAVVAMGAAIGAQVVAEGVEDAAALARVREVGFDLAQGFHTGAPTRELPGAAGQLRGLSLLEVDEG